MEGRGRAQGRDVRREAKRKCGELGGCPKGEATKAEWQSGGWLPLPVCLC